MKQPSLEELTNFFREWFIAEYGLPPVVTSSTGLPAVAFAQAVLNRYGSQSQSEADA